jgi:hypothetical protein
MQDALYQDNSPRFACPCEGRNAVEMNGTNETPPTSLPAALSIAQVFLNYN